MGQTHGRNGSFPWEGRVKAQGDLLQQKRELLHEKAANKKILGVEPGIFIYLTLYFV